MLFPNHRQCNQDQVKRGHLKKQISPVHYINGFPSFSASVFNSLHFTLSPPFRNQNQSTQKLKIKVKLKKEKMGESARNSTRVAETEIPESSITSFSKKMNFDFEEFNSPSLNLKLQPHRCTDMSPQKVVSPGNSSNPSGVLTGFSSCGDSPVLSCCSSNAPVQVVKDSLRFLDLEVKFEVQNLEVG
jgi:hypothetical protein